MHKEHLGWVKNPVIDATKQLQMSPGDLDNMHWSD